MWYALHGITSLSAKTLRQTNRRAHEAQVLETRDGYMIQKVLEQGNAFTDGLPVVPVSTSKDVVIFVLAQPTHKSNLKSSPKEPGLPTHLLQTVDDKPVGFHNGPDLRRQRAQQLTRSLLFARISQGERGNKINMGVRVRFVFVEPQMDHVWVQSRTRRVKARSARAKESVATNAVVAEPSRDTFFGFVP